MCDMLSVLMDKVEILVAVAFVMGLFLEYFPRLKDLEVYQRDLIAAGLAIVLPVGAFLLGAVQSCWGFTWEAATPFVVAGLAAMVAALGGERVVNSRKCYTSIKNK